MNIYNKSIIELQHNMAAGLLSSKQLTIYCLERICELNGHINAVAELNPEAIAIAEALDRERVKSGARSLMHGIPVLLKDNISTGDKLHTTAGSVALADNFAVKDSPVAAALRKNGAVILGKANMSEFARYIAMDFSDGYSSRGGQVLNPYGDELDVSGSSSGSAAAVASGMCTVAVGTETAGSITCPSMNNMLCGLKPTVGLCSRSGIIPICSQDTAGPMAKTVSDCAALFDSMITPDDPDDPSTHCIPRVKSYIDFLDKNGLCGLRIGVNRVRSEKELFPDDCEAIFEAELEKLKNAGAELIDCDIPYTGLENGILSQASLLYEFKSAMGNYLSRWSSGKCKSLSDIIEYNNAHAAVALRYGQDLLLAAEETSGRLLERDYWSAKLDAIKKGQQFIDDAIAEHRLDLFVCACYTNLPAITGYPVLVVPMGFSKTGLPLGMSFYGTAYSEPTLFNAAYSYEQFTEHRVPPELCARSR